MANAVAAPLRLEIITERTPLSYRSSDNLGDGQATEVVQGLMARAGIDYDLFFAPWKRGYRRAELEPNILIYPLARTEEREAKFHWLGQLTPVHYYLFKLAERKDIKVNDFSDVNRYKVGVVTYHAHHIFLQRMGVSSLEGVYTSRQNMNKLLRKRISLFASSSSGLIRLCQQEKQDCKQFEPVIKLQGISKGLYLAASKATDPKLAQSLRASFNEMEREGVLGEIMGERMNLPDHDRFLSHFHSAMVAAPGRLGSEAP
ncbi:MAG: transporter substrate-binding domain-containing protein [Cellvibrionaceae bacterium]|nr:transporter substrate-binding domain-containing protein [Cellvibrionaceae bacterium]